MGRRIWVVSAGLAVLLAISPATGLAQGKGGGKPRATAGAAQVGGGRQGGGKAQATARPQQGGGKAQATARPRQGGGAKQQGPARAGAQAGRAQEKPQGGSARAGGSAKSAGSRGQPGSKAAAGNAGKGGGGKAEAGDRGARAEVSARGKEAGRSGAGGNAGAAGTSVRARSHALARQQLERLPRLRALEASGRRSDRYVVGAIALAAVHGLNADGLDLRRRDDRVEVWNRRGELLFDLDEDRARNLGSWDLRLLGDRAPRSDAPAFCRSGAGHPVWGREWCLDRGYGLGRSNDRLWSRTTSITDIIFRRPTTQYAYRYDRPTLLELLGDAVLGRLALHALSLGFDQPLAGRWVAEPQAPHLLVIDSGTQPVAELVDLDGDNRVDVLYVSQYGW